MKRQTLLIFMRTNRESIDVAIRRKLGRIEYPISQAERRMWILNDEGLYNWARAEGVKI